MIEVSIDELKADLERHLRAAQNGEGILIKEGDNPIARLVEPGTATFRTIPPLKPIHELKDLKGERPAGLRPGDLDEAVRWTKADWIDRNDDE